ncbi:MAG: hypothetical protein QNJ97_07690 [Myxococcota bacterium]|nr:hypothetical protein [Myxococcota bacterium]
MNIGSHLPAYLFCEQFVSGKRVLDCHPVDDQGIQIFGRSARSVVAILGERNGPVTPDIKSCQCIRAFDDCLPFAEDSIDLIFYNARGSAARLAALSDFLKSVRSIAGPKGLVCLLVPNRDARDLDGHLHADLPDYFDVERTLRRHFPHVTLLAVKPLHGAQLNPIGREPVVAAPILDDRLLPQSGEMPSHFLGICCLSYRRVDESIIAQVPYDLMAETIREKLIELRASIAITRSESDMRGREITKLEKSQGALEAALEKTEILKHEKASISAALRDAEQQLGLRDKLQAESERINQEQAARILDLDKNLFDARQCIRKHEQTVAEQEQKVAIALREREDAEKDRDQAAAVLRTARAEVKERQRILDDAKEDVAGLEAEIATLNRELEKQRHEVVTARERAIELELEKEALKDRQAEANSIEAELSRVRTVAAGDRERMETRLNEEHARLLEEIAARSAAEQQATLLTQKLDDIQINVSRLEQQSDTLSARLDRVTKERDQAQTDRQDAQHKREESDLLAREQADALARSKQQLERMAQQAAQAEQTALEENKALLERMDVLAQALEVGNQELAREILQLTARLELTQGASAELQSPTDLKDYLQQATEKVGGLIEDLSRVNSLLAYEKEQASAEHHRAEAAESRERQTLERALEIETAFDQTRAEAASQSDALETLTAELEDTKSHVILLKSALAEAEAKQQSMRETELQRLMEKETELLQVSGDLEKELKATAARYENAQGEIWELREEVTRLQAQAAAAQAAEEHMGAAKEFNDTLQAQAAMIAKLKKDRDMLKKKNDQLRIAIRKQKKPH